MNFGFISATRSEASAAIISLSRQPAVDREPIEQTIHTVAVRRLAVADTSIVRFQASGATPGDDGMWFLLSVRTSGGDWKFLGRRRSKAELLTLVGTIDQRHLNGKRV